MNEFMKAAWDEVKIGLDEGNLPVGSVVVKDGQIIGVGRNRQHQTGDPTTHAELEAIRDAARRAPGQDPVDLLKNAICYTTMMPCPMCAGAIIRFGFSKVVVAETPKLCRCRHPTIDGTSRTQHRGSPGGKLY